MTPSADSGTPPYYIDGLSKEQWILHQRAGWVRAAELERALSQSQAALAEARDDALAEARDASHDAIHFVIERMDLCAFVQGHVDEALIALKSPAAKVGQDTAAQPAETSTAPQEIRSPEAEASETRHGTAGAAHAVAPENLRGEERTRYIHEYDCPTAWDFFHKHGMGSKLCPSCLMCGQQVYPGPERKEWAIRHMELPNIYICMACVTKARSAPPAASEPGAVAVMWMLYYLREPTKNICWSEAEAIELKRQMDLAHGYAEDRTIVPLYASPPAPKAEVKGKRRG